MAWTNEQQLAIDKDNTNIIVSAGAGSGKTAVLTERVIRKLKQGVSINRLLVLTFTKEAAKEMKERIRKKIEKDESLKEQLEYLEQSYITTFDSFSLSIVRKYHYLLNVKKDIDIIDSNFIDVKKKEVLEDIFEELYKIEEENFSKLINDFCTKDDDQVKQQILSISNLLDLKIDKEEYLDKYVEGFYDNKNIEKIISQYTKLIKEKKQEIIDLISDTKCIDNDYYKSIEEKTRAFINSNSYEEIKKAIDFEVPRLKKGSTEELKETKENLSNAIKELKKLLSYNNENEIKEELISTKPYVTAIINIIKELDKRIAKEKQKYDTYEFIDIAKMAIRIVKDYPEIKEEIKNYYNEIMVDEYQDTSDLQEIFINEISNNNVYMVGDIKQSIYRFRNANPTIFKDKYEKYKDNNNGIKIDLLKNFRSRKEVLNDINNIFNQIMDLDIGGADYKKTHQMVAGNINYEESINSNLDIYNYDTEDKTYSKEEKEIFIIANDIKEKINNKYQVLDKETNTLRDATLSDFCIMMDRGTEFDTYKKIFEYMELPLTIYKDENLTEDTIIHLFKNILGLIIKDKLDQEFKYYFTSISRSFLLEKNDSDIYNTFINNSFKETELYQIISDIKKEINNKNLKQTIELIIDKFDIYKRLIKIGNINKNITEIEQIIDISETLNNLGYDINDFYNYLNNMIEEGIDIRYNNANKDSNSVKIMNIHKSKGLEFPICYYSGLHKTFNKSDIKQRFLYSNAYGIITPSFNDGITDTITKTLFKEETNKEEISEKIRLFYVALTRAREKMIIVTSLKEDDKEYKTLTSSKKLKYNSFLDIINSIRYYLENNIKSININDIYMTKEYKNTRIKELKKEETKENLKVININVNNEIKEESRYSKDQIKLNTKEEIENIEEGLKMHYLLEIDDFYDPKYDITKKLIKHLDLKDANIYKEYEFITDETHGFIDLMIEYSDSIKIIDYKLKNIQDEAYLKQLNGYKNYIEQKTNKKTEIYLYSILEDNLINL